MWPDFWIWDGFTQATSWITTKKNSNLVEKIPGNSKQFQATRDALGHPPSKFECPQASPGPTVPHIGSAGARCALQNPWAETQIRGAAPGGGVGAPALERSFSQFSGPFAMGLGML